jgi:hypothetical protein
MPFALNYLLPSVTLFRWQKALLPSRRTLCVMHPMDINTSRSDRSSGFTVDFHSGTLLLWKATLLGLLFPPLFFGAPRAGLAIPMQHICKPARATMRSGLANKLHAHAQLALRGPFWLLLIKPFAFCKRQRQKQIA